MTLRLAYADPPYPGQGMRYEHQKEVNHPLLFEYLTTFDGWAYSCGSVDLRYVMGIAPECRVGAWVKPFASFKPNVSPAYAWEPVLFSPARKATRDQGTPRDYVAAGITLQRGLTGAKPDGFSMWLFAVLGARPADDFTDIFPGSGAVSRAWDAFSRQMNLFA